LKDLDRHDFDRVLHLLRIQTGGSAPKNYTIEESKPEES
jgi:hypothetical protein